MMLALSDICKSHAGAAVLRGCAYAFDRPGVYVLTGDNGSGKSTLLRICALLDRPDSGSVSYSEHDGAPIASNIALRRRITLVLPRVGLFDTTVLGNVRYGLELRGASLDAADEALEAVGLAQLKHQRALTLSSGETQRLGIARALAIKPELLMLDEPTASIDRANTEAIERIIMGIKREGRRTVIMTTHDAQQAARLGDVVIELKDGALR